MLVRHLHVERAPEPSLNHASRMNDDDDFIAEKDDSLPVRIGLTGWETVIFELADADDAE